jgi:hypothetical protein
MNSTVQTQLNTKRILKLVPHPTKAYDEAVICIAQLTKGFLRIIQHAHLNAYVVILFMHSFTCEQD